MNTVGFKKDVPVFETLLSSKDIYRGTGRSLKVPSVHIFLREFLTDFSAGSLKSTGNPLDVAIDGEGFFKIETERGDRYTRRGNFAINQENILVTSEGYPVLGKGGKIIIDGEDVVINSGGEVIIDDSVKGTIQVVGFTSTSSLKKDRDGLYAFLGEENQIEDVENSQIKQGLLESSNVNTVKEMTNMIEVLRTYETYQKVIQVLDEISSKSINKVGHV